jgi:hypothetical protein
MYNACPAWDKGTVQYFKFQYPLNYKSTETQNLKNMLILL